MLDLRVRFATPEDEPSLDELSTAVLGPIDRVGLQQRRRWQYFQNPYATHHPELLLGEVEDRVLAQTGGLPVPLRLDGIPIDAAWGSDTMVHPAWRRQGIAGRLISAWMEQCPHKLGLGFGPSEGNRPVLLRLGYQTLGRVTGYYLRNEDWSGSVPESVEVRALATDDPRIDLLWQQVQSSYRALVTRDQSWLAWRFGASEQPRYSLFGALRGDSLCGYIVLRVSPRRGTTTLLVDWLAHPDDTETLDSLLGHAHRFGRDQQATGVFAYASHAQLSERLLRCGFRSPPGFGDELFAWMADHHSLSLPDLSQWHLTLADSDKDRPP